MTLPLTFEDSSSSRFELPLPPDLLRRFVTCPHCGTWRIAGVTLDVETNSEELLKSIPLQQESTGISIRLRVVVDDDIASSNGGDPFLIDSGQLCLGYMSGMLFAFDRAAGEAFVFLSEAVVEKFEGTFEELLRGTEPILADDEAFRS